MGWHLSREIDTALTLTALDRARAARQPPPGLIHHSDRGVQYASAAYVARLTEADARELASTWWPAGFAGVAQDEFRSLLSEMVGLGVLVWMSRRRR